MNKILLIILSFPLLLRVQAQQTKQQYIDSMLALLPAAPDDTNKTKLIYRIGDAYTAIDPKKSMHYALLGLEDAKKKKFAKGVASFNISIGNLVSDAGYYDSAFHYFEIAYEINQRISYKKGMASALINMGTCKQRAGNDVESIRYLMQAIPVAEAIQDNYLLSIAYNNLADIYVSQHKYDEAEHLTNKSLGIATHSGNKRDLAAAYYSLGSIAYEKRDTTKAFLLFSRSLNEYIAAADQYGIASSYGALGSVEKDLLRALDYKLKAQLIWDSLSPTYPGSINNIGNIGFNYLEIAQHNISTDLSRGQLLDKSNDYLQRAIALSREAGDAENYSFYLGNLSSLQELRGDYKNALISQRESTRIHDSLYSQENKNAIAKLATEGEMAVKDKELRLNQLSLRNQRRQLIVLIAGLALLTIIGALLYRQSRTRKRTNTRLVNLNAELDEANKIKARFFGIISHDLRSPIANLVSFLNLQKEEPGIFTAEQAAAHRQTIHDSADRLLETMEAMLLWSKSQMENFRPQQKKVRIDDLFDYLRKTFPGTSNTNIVFQPAAGLMVVSDEQYLRTILHNLTANAITALHGRPGSLIEWKAYRKNNEIFLAITDNGPGIKAEQAAVLYDEHAAVNGPNGLGLHLVRDMARAIKCAVKYQSTSKGTMFELAISD